MSFLKVNPRSTPSPIKIAGRSNDTGNVINMNTAGWVCYSEIQTQEGASLSDPRMITATAAVDGVIHFNAEMSLDEADLLTDIGATYIWQLTVENELEPFRQVEPIEICVVDGLSSLDIDSVDDFKTIDPRELPNRLPTSDELCELALLDDLHVDQDSGDAESKYLDKRKVITAGQINDNRNLDNAQTVILKEIMKGYELWASQQPLNKIQTFPAWLACIGIGKASTTPTTPATGGFTFTIGG